MFVIKKYVTVVYTLSPAFQLQFRPGKQRKIRPGDRQGNGEMMRRLKVSLKLIRTMFSLSCEFLKVFFLCNFLDINAHYLF